MNGEDKILEAVHKIDNRLTAMETTTALHHEQNQKDVVGIGNLARAIEKHCHEIGKLKVHRAIHWVILGAIAAALILK